MPKVVHVSVVNPRPLSDPRVFLKECISLRSAGYEVVLVCSAEQDCTCEGVRIRALPQPAGRLSRMLVTTRQAYHACVEENADVYHFHNPEMMPWMARLASAGRRVIYDMHENVVKDILTKSWIHPWLRAVVSRAVNVGMRGWLRRMAVVFAEDSYASDYPWIHSGVVVRNLPRLEHLLSINPEPSTVPLVGYLGGVTPERGTMTILEALHVLQKRGVSVGFECVGHAEGKFQAEMDAFVAAHGLEGVRFHGYQRPQDGYRIMARCQVGIAVIADIPNFRDSYPTKMFEYMALGLPVIASDFPLYRQVVEDGRCGVCVPPGRPSELASAIYDVITDPQAAQEMGRRGRDCVVEHYSWRTEEEKLLGLYSALLAGASPRLTELRTTR